jgi:hypothetical protein
LQRNFNLEIQSPLTERDAENEFESYRNVTLEDEDDEENHSLVTQKNDHFAKIKKSV